MVVIASGWVFRHRLLVSVVGVRGLWWLKKFLLIILLHQICEFFLFDSQSTTIMDSLSPDGRRLHFLKSLFLVCLVFNHNFCYGAVNANAKKRREAKSKTKRAYEKSHRIVFDDYGRVLRWGREAKKIDCKYCVSSCIRNFLLLYH